MFLLFSCLMPVLLLADPCPEDVTPPVISSKGSTWDCTYDIFLDSDTNFIEVTEESACGLKKVEIADWDMIRGNCSDPYVKRYTVIWYAEDIAGNSTNFTQEITIVRPQISEVSFPNDTMVQCPSSGYDNAELFGYPTIQGRDIGDKCGIRVKYNLLDTIKSLEGGSCLTEVRKEWTVISGCDGTIMKDTQYIILIDTIRPIIACTALNPVTRLVIDPETCCAIYQFPEADAVDFCAPDEELVFRYRINGAITGSEVALKAGNYEGSIIVTDPCMNADTCYYEIEVVDESPPLFVCPLENPVVELSSSSQQVSVADLGLTADDCSESVNLLYRFATQAEGEEASSQTFTCDLVNSTVDIVVMVSDMDGNESTPISCSVDVTDGGNGCPVLRSAFVNSGQEDISDMTSDKNVAPYYNGHQVVLNSEIGVTALRLYNISGSIIWEKKWEQQKYKYQSTVSENLKSGVYILKLENGNGHEENIKLAVF